METDGRTKNLAWHHSSSCVPRPNIPDFHLVHAKRAAASFCIPTVRGSDCSRPRWHPKFRPQQTQRERFTRRLAVDVSCSRPHRYRFVVISLLPIFVLTPTSHRYCDILVDRRLPRECPKQFSISHSRRAISRHISDFQRQRRRSPRTLVLESFPRPLQRPQNLRLRNTLLPSQSRQHLPLLLPPHNPALQHGILTRPIHPPRRPPILLRRPPRHHL